MKTLLTILAICAPALSFAYDTEDMIAKKRYEAEQRKMQMLQEIQHRQANPEAYIASKMNESSGGTYTIEPGDNGHYYVDAKLNGRIINFIADTGATDIFLTQNDARTAGINTSNLNYNITYRTANGLVKAGETTVTTFTVGPIRLNDVKVSVSQNTDGVSLLGMSFFRKLSRYEVRDGKLTLYK